MQPVKTPVQRYYGVLLRSDDVRQRRERCPLCSSAGHHPYNRSSVGEFGRSKLIEAEEAGATALQLPDTSHHTRTA
jgi:hypothetical protein